MWWRLRRVVVLPQNVVAQQQTLNTIDNAIAAKVLNLLADKDAAITLEQIRPSRQHDDGATQRLEDRRSPLPLVGPPGRER